MQLNNLNDHCTHHTFSVMCLLEIVSGLKIIDLKSLEFYKFMIINKIGTGINKCFTTRTPINV